MTNDLARGSTTIPGLSGELVTSWVTSLVPDAVPPFHVERVGLGQSNLTYAVSDRAGRRWVLRRPPVGDLLHSAHNVVREARILAALGRTEVPVPEVLGIAQAGHVGEAPLVLMEFVDGDVLDRPAVVDAMSTDARRAAGMVLPETLARIHAVDLDAVGLADLASHSPYVQRQLKRWTAQWEGSKTRESPALDRLTEQLTRAVPAPDRVALVHGDLHLRNIIVAPDSGEVRAALDWELATLGEPLADLGTTLAYWPEPGEVALEGLATSTNPGFPSRREIVERYATVSGQDIHEATMGFWHVLGLWKLAIIGEGVLRRAMSNPGNRAASGTPDVAALDGIIGNAQDIASRVGL